ncbi:HlyIII-domain-containing protein [Coniophora puteana RWD-64-598 SS2]|uniref:HlyIII-domain-containing protein n=1 Tax=Coniophora puteana (strain RWD-64-598) TaxID=741705 RepID=A0A5M3MVS7_CONPW|nr:HlyIII-domain-containing protein [Coniophora puteana RWD-64-598 SS2]EIW83236.1 HlyIII-domain-containing protein [Coniophora puteana RWD-64-598 SS2]
MSTSIKLDSPEHFRARRRRRGFSTNDAARTNVSSLCQRLPHSLEALDLSSASAKETLATLRLLILSYLADVEARLKSIEPPTPGGLSESLKAKGELKAEEARVWVNDTLEMLHSIRSDVHSHLPELHFSDLSVESLKAHLPDVRSHFPAMTFSDIFALLEDARHRFSDLDISTFKSPTSYLPTLSDRLHSLQSHLRSVDLKSGELSINTGHRISEIFDAIMSSELVTELSDDVTEAEGMIERAARDVGLAVKRSLEGAKLITYMDLPPQWRNNPFVTGGYRFIPIERWPLIVLSLFEIHNETLNIHTHLVPLLLWVLNVVPIFNATSVQDIPEVAFISFALLCLSSSVLWHTMAGCAHFRGMELCARIDYVGIGWLISASVGTVVHYGFQCNPDVGRFFLLCCLATGVAGNVCPFFQWFDDPAYKSWRILFFLCMGFTAIGPLAALAYLHSYQEVMAFAAPVRPSIVSYLVGLVFYASHIPERFLSARYAKWLDWCGGGSHAIWHAFVVLAISQHRVAIGAMRSGIQCPA